MEIQTTLLFITASVNSILSLFVLLGKRNRINIIYSIFVLFASFWSIGLGFFILQSDLNIALYIADFYYISAAGIPLFFLYFSLLFPNNSVNLKKYSYLSFPFVVLILLFILDKNFLIEHIIKVSWGKDVVLDKLHYVIYSVYFIVYTVASYINLIRSLHSNVSLEEKKQLMFVLIGTIVGFVCGMLFNLFLPLGGNYQYIFIGPLFSFCMVLAITYSITKHHLFDIKVIATESVTYIMWILILIRTFLSETLQDQIINGVSLLVAVLLGTILIRSVIKEVQLRERIENLAKDLEKANQNLERANSRLTELDELKSEFLSLATHQIRAPLTAIKGYASLIVEGDYGDISPGVRDAVQTIFRSCQNLVVIVGEFLDISRIEQGRMKYELSDFDLKKLIADLMVELKPILEGANVSMDFVCVGECNFITHADIGKTKQVIGNIVDNAIKYAPHGEIHIRLAETDMTATVAVKDNGIGIAKEDIGKLFSKFVRAKDANKTNVIGTGLGLYVAKQMIEAQGGKIWVESEGIGKGSTFYIELPKNGSGTKLGQGIQKSSVTYQGK